MATEFTVCRTPKITGWDLYPTSSMYNIAFLVSRLPCFLSLLLDGLLCFLHGIRPHRPGTHGIMHCDATGTTDRDPYIVIVRIDFRI